MDEDGHLLDTFSERSIRVTASRLGIDNVNVSVCRHISKEAFYKTNELIYTAKKIMYRNKRAILTTEDVQKAMSLLGNVQIYGHDNGKPSNFIQSQKDVFREDDSEVNLVKVALEGKTTTSHYAEPRIEGKWVLADDPGARDVESDPYYEELAKCLLTGQPQHVQVVVKDLRSNPQIALLAPFFLNFIASTLNKTDDIVLVNNLLDAVYALAVNRFIDPRPYIDQAVSNVVRALMNVVIRTRGQDRNDWSDSPVRLKSGLLIEKLNFIWAIDPKQQDNIAATLASCLSEKSLPLQSHYGAISALTAIAPSLPKDALRIYWRNIENYFSPLASLPLQDDNLKHLMTALLVAWRNHCPVDQLLYAIFGDSVVPFRIPRVRAVSAVSPSVQSPRPNLKLKLNLNASHRWYIHRNLKQCRPSHARSAVGDFSLTL